MIRVDIEENGDLTLRCTICPKKDVIPMDDIKCVFGDMHVGMAVLQMAAHCTTKHERIPAK